MSALRVVQPRRVRALAILFVVIGITAFEGSGARGPAAWIGFALLAGGLAILDGLAEGRLGLRQAALAVVIMGTAAALWSALVMFLFSTLELPIPIFVYAVLAISLPGAASAAWALSRDRSVRTPAAVHALPHRGGRTRAA